jgi:probable HAF family extracellular repeat protein
MKSKIWLVIVVICLTAFVQATPLGATSYHYQDLNPQGAPPGATYQFAAINDAKQIVGNIFQFTGGKFVAQAFHWDPNKGYTLLKSLGSNTNSQAFSINKQGQIAGMSVNVIGYEHACLWTDPAQAPIELGSADDPNPSGAYGINDAGLMVGYYGNPEHAYKWTASMQGTDLGTLGGSTSGATGVNNAGQIVGNAADGNGIIRACIWHPGIQSPQSLGLSAPLSNANCINNQGNVAGYYSPSGSGADDQAFYWDHQTETIVSNIPPQLYYNSILGMSDANQVVGWSVQEGFNNQSIIFWNPIRGTQDLNKLVVNLPKGVTIQALYAISPKNGYIAGTDSQGHVCLCTPVVASSGTNLLLLLE